MGTLHRDAAGRHYREAGRCPYAELVAGTPFLLPGDPEVHVRRPRVDTPSLDAVLPGLADAIRNRTVVIVLEPLD